MVTGVQTCAPDLGSGLGLDALGPQAQYGQPVAPQSTGYGQVPGQQTAPGAPQQAPHGQPQQPQYGQAPSGQAPQNQQPYGQSGYTS